MAIKFVNAAEMLISDSVKVCVDTPSTYGPYVADVIDKMLNGWSLFGQPPKLQYASPWLHEYTKGNMSGHRIRFDYAFSQESGTTEMVLPFIVDAVSNEIQYLIINGDTKSSDPLLKAFDGTMKTGLRAETLVILGAQMYLHHNLMKDINEIILYMVIHVDWETS